MIAKQLSNRRRQIAGQDFCPPNDTPRQKRGREPPADSDVFLLLHRHFDIFNYARFGVVVFPQDVPDLEQSDVFVGGDSFELEAAAGTVQTRPEEVFERLNYSGEFAVRLVEDKYLHIKHPKIVDGNIPSPQADPRFPPPRSGACCVRRITAKMCCPRPPTKTR